MATYFYLVAGMTKQYIYHTSPDQHIHKGPSSDCPTCRRAKKKKVKTKKEKCQVSGKSGGKKSAAVTHTRKCPCGAKINRDNKTGLCIKCYNKQRRIEKEKLKPPQVGPRYCSADGCNTKLSPGNTSGLCAKCFRKSDRWRQRREHHSNWVKSAVFSQDVKDASGNP